MDERSTKPAREVTDEGSKVTLRVDRLADGPTESGPTLYCTDSEGTELRLAVRDSSVATPSETGEWYRFDGVVRSRSLGAELLLPSGDGSPDRLDAPESGTHPPLAELDDPWLIQLGASERVLAVTVQPRPTDGMASLSAQDPETFEIGAVCLEQCGGNGDTTVYHREEPDTRDEHLLLQHVVEDLAEAAGATLVVRSGGQSPLEMLSTRLALAGEGDVVADGAARVLDDCFHVDVERVAVRTGAETVDDAARQLGIDIGPVSLDDYDIGVDPADWRQGWEIDSGPLSGVSDPRLSNRDYATLVERYLADEDGPMESAQLADCLKAYASADGRLLREFVTRGIVDQLACQRVAGYRLQQHQSG